MAAIQTARFDYERWVSERVAAATQEWTTQQFRDEWLHLHLYYRPSTPELAGDLRVCESAPEGYMLADGRRLSPAWTEQQVRYHIADISRRLPILPYTR